MLMFLDLFTRLVVVDEQREEDHPEEEDHVDEEDSQFQRHEAQIDERRRDEHEPIFEDRRREVPLARGDAAAQTRALERREEENTNAVKAGAWRPWSSATFSKVTAVQGEAVAGSAPSSTFCQTWFHGAWSTSPKKAQRATRAASGNFFLSFSMSCAVASPAPMTHAAVAIFTGSGSASSAAR